MSRYFTFRADSHMPTPSANNVAAMTVSSADTVAFVLSVSGDELTSKRGRFARVLSTSFSGWSVRIDAVFEQHQHAVARHDAVVAQALRERTNPMLELCVAHTPFAAHERQLVRHALRGANLHVLQCSGRVR